MKKTAILFLLIGGLILSSCNSVNSKREQISKLEKEIASSKMTKIDENKVDQLIKKYDEFVKEFPKDTATPKYLFRKADLYVAVNRGNLAINTLDQLISSYPNFEKIPECFFLKAFIAENTLHHLSLADKYYKEFLKEFPTHKLAKDAEASMLNLGKSPEQLIAEFEAKQDSLSKVEGK